MKKLLLKGTFISMILLVSMMFVQCGSSVSKEVEDGLKQAAEMINKQAPIMVDQITRLDKAEVDGKELTYYYTITNTEGIDKTELEKNVKAGLKNNPQMSMFAKYDVELTYKYSDADGKEFCKFSVKSSEYK